MPFTHGDPSFEYAKQLIDEAVKFFIVRYPAMKENSLVVIETIFAPKTIMKQLILAIMLETGAMTIHQFSYLLRDISTLYSKRARWVRTLEKLQHTANSQDEWMDLAERIDYIQGNDLWRSDPNCFLYERDRISARIDEFIHLMRRRDTSDLMFTLRGGIARNKFGLLHEGLFSKALAGSKVLVETYHNVVCAALDFCCDSPVPSNEEPIPTDARLAFFNETRHSYGRTALLLSGGAALGIYHVGVVKCLLENGLLPRVLGCSSAGSIVGAMVATRTDEEMVQDLFEVKGTTAPGHSGVLQLDFFRALKSSANRIDTTDKIPPFQQPGFAKGTKTIWQLMVPRGFRTATSALYDVLTGKRRPQHILMNDTNHLRECIRLNVGDFTFQEAFDRTGRILNISVTPQNRSDPPRLLNYLTAPHVLVYTAAVASSSLPGVFEANKLLVKDADGTVRHENSAAEFADGSLEQDLPMQQLSEMFNINHFIISQANPHASMFGGYHSSSGVWANPFLSALRGTLRFLKSQCKEWLVHTVALIGASRIAPMFSTSRGLHIHFFTQEYEGRTSDISLIPWLNHRSLISALFHVLYNCREDEFREWVLAAERETWKHLPAIKSHCAEEMTLDRCVQRLRKRLVYESGENRRATKQHNNMSSRVPSFFTSRSLANLGGLGIGDTAVKTDFEASRTSLLYKGNDLLMQPIVDDIPVDYKQGWGGMGLRGNQSKASLNSHHSGLFLEDLDEEEETINGEHSEHMSTRVAGLPKQSNEQFNETEYVKTTSMADFYYRQKQEVFIWK